MTKEKEILEALKAGKITPDEAVEQYEYQAKHISEVELGDLTVDVLDCGFPSLNDLMVFKRGYPDLIVFGARPSQGKSAFMFQVAKYVSVTETVLIYSLEMDNKSIKRRMVAAETGRGLTQLQKGLVPKEMIADAVVKIDRLKYFVDDSSGLDVRGIRSSANAFHRRHPVSLVVVDYLQLVKTRDRNSRNEEVGDITSELKGMARDLSCPVLVASQLNRACEYRGKETGDYMPIMADLRDSGNIEQDADLILFLSRESVYTKSGSNVAQIDVSKNRNGPTGRIDFTFLAASASFVDKASIPPVKPRTVKTESKVEEII